MDEPFEFIIERNQMSEHVEDEEPDQNFNTELRVPAQNLVGYNFPTGVDANVRDHAPPISTKFESYPTGF